MNLIDYFRILIRRGWIMILLAVIAGGSAFWFSRQQDPVYRSTQKVLMIPSRSDFGLTEATTRLLNSHVAYLDSTLIATDVIDRLQLDMTPGQLKGTTTIVTNRDSLLIQIDVNLSNGDLANDIARTYGDILIDYRNTLNQEAQREDRVNARMQDVATYSQIRPRPMINAAVGAILGLVVGGVIVFVLEYLESNIIHRREDVERSLNLPVLATVPGK